MRKISFFALLVLVLVPQAMAHVEASPERVPAGGVARITLAAEGEESVPAVKLTVQMPAGVTDANGEVVHWIGAESSETPAPRVTLGAVQQSKPPPPTEPPPVITTTVPTQDED